MKKPKPVPKWYEEQFDWLFSIYPEIAKKYPNKWIAFMNGKILSSGKSLKSVMEKAHQKVKQEEIPHLFIEKGIHIYEN